MYMALRRLYNFCALSGLYIRIQILCSKWLVHTNTCFACKSAYAYMYGLCALSNLCVQIRLLRSKRVMCTCMACAL